MPRKRRIGSGAPDDHPSSAQADRAAPKSSADGALAMAMRFISYRPRSVKESIQKLTDNGFSNNAVEDAINRLICMGCLDDERFARELAGSRIRNKNWGIKKVAFDLRSKGIPDDIVHAALSGIDASADTETAARAFEKWIRKTDIKFPLEKKLFEKAFRHLAARGFSAQVIMGLLKGKGRED